MNNYSNLYLNVLGEQVLSLQNRVEQLFKSIDEKSVKVDKPVELTTQKAIEIATPSIQPPPEITGFKLKPIKEQEEFLEEKFKNSKISTLDNKLRDTLIEEPDHKQVYQDQLNKIHKWADTPTTGKYYYPRPTPADILIEESN